MVLAIVIGIAAGAAPALAQRQPQSMPWERAVEKFFSRSSENPLKQFDRDFQKGLEALGLPSNLPVKSILSLVEPAPAAPTVVPYQRLDGNGDGSVSLSEYMIGRSRQFSVGPRGKARRKAHRTRLNSRFRAADVDRDRKLSGNELLQIRNPRF